ncbi:MAG TPA: CHRD domain-containing protein [Burkholderiales bacterium]|nr:CHRD domain-containing protein [Burkholderiales bacterium]
MKRYLWAGVAGAALLLAACAEMPWSAGTHVTLSGAQEVPPVMTGASGSATITVAADHAVSGSVTTSGIRGIAAHIHQGAPGKNGPVIIPLTMTSENTWEVPAGAKLSNAQYAAYKAGDLYVNVHSEAHRGGEIRGQIKP